MKKNTSGQVIGAQMVSASDGSAFTGSVTVYVTGDGGTQAVGSVGSGACTHEGNGFHTYAPAQGETNYDHVAFTFIGTGAVPATVQVYPSFPQTGDNFARLGAPAGASVSADIAAVKTQTAAIEVDTQDIQSRLPAALVSGRIDASVGAMASGVLTATAIAADAITAAKVAADVTTEIQSGLATASALSTLQSSVDTIDGIVDAILVDTAEIGAAGAGLTALASAANLATVAGYVDTEVAAIKAVTDKLDTTLAATSDGYAFTPDALENAPGAGSAPSAAEIADAVWEEAIADHSGTSGSTAEALAAAGSAGDPWITALPGSYSAGQAGYILGTNLNATISSRASQTSVDTIDGIVDSILLDTAEIGAAGAGLTAIPWNPAWDAEVQSEAADALAAYDPPTKAELDAAVAPLATAAALATVDTVVDAILVDTAEIGAAGAGLTALASATNLATVAGYLDTEIAAIKAKTDNLPASPAASGDVPSAASNAAAVLAATVEGSVTVVQSLRLANAALAGKASGLETTNALFRDLGDSKNRIDATVDADGNRSAVTLDLT